jgi:hypothetical protein
MKSEDYKRAIKSGKIETASMDFPKSAIIRDCNLLILLERAGFSFPKGQISGLELDRLMSIAETRGIDVPIKPLNTLSDTECRCLIDLCKENIPEFAKRTDKTTDNMTAKQRALFNENLRYKAGFTKNSHGNWVKLK